MDKHVLIFSIGPVQPFIQAARTTRDLAFGSRMLSELSKAVAALLQQKGAELIFPAPQSPNDLAPWTDFNVSNQIVAVVEGDPAAIAQEVRHSLQQRLQAWFDKALQELPPRQRGAFLKHPAYERARTQLERLLEIYWAAAEMPGPESYAQARARTLAALRLRKNTRDFAAWPGVAGVPKSALDGFREAVIVVQGAQNQNTSHIQRYRQIGHVFLLHESPPRFKEGEALSGVDVLKRLGGYAFLKKNGRDVPSTSDMAAKPLMDRLGAQQVKAWKEALVKVLTTDFQVDPKTAASETEGVYFFPERVADLITGANVYERRAQFRQKFQALWKSVLGENTPAPHPYYALLIADGDGMGKIIDAQQTKGEHQKLSQTLAQFAQKARQILKEHGGFPVYTGGDDIMALFPLHTVLDALQKLDQEFRKMMTIFSDSQGRTPTLSGGLIIVHHLLPMDDVHTAAREAERWAKERTGKHALAVKVLHRSGEAIQVRSQWPEMLEHLRTWVHLFMGEDTPRGLPYALQDLARFLKGTHLNAEAQRLEALRVIRQKREARGKEGGFTQIEQELQRRIANTLTPEQARKALEQIAQEMLIAQDIARAYRIAG